MKLYHGTTSVFTEIDLAKSNSAKDFGRGFYLSADRAQAENWAKFKSVQTGEAALVMEFDFDESVLERADLAIARFESYTEQWARFVLENRNNLSGENSHQYDIVVGPIANDKVGTQIRNYFEGNITFEILLERLKYMKGITFQYFFGTPRAIKHLRRL